MAGSVFRNLHSCSSSYHDHDCFQLQLLSLPEATPTAVAPGLRARKKNRPRLLFSANPFPDGVLHSEFEKGRRRRKKSAESFIVRATANPTLDRCRNDANNAFPNEESPWRSEVLSALQRSLLESLWALQSAQKCFGNEGTVKLENSKCNYPQQSATAAVRSGQVSARQRRLRSRLKSSSQNREGSLRALGFMIPAKLQYKTKKGKFKVDPLPDFISSFLRPTNGYGMLTKDQERGFTRQMRICQSLEKAKRELKERFGYDPSYELWAKSVDLSTEELLSLVNKGEVARNKMLYSHLRLVVAVAKYYQNLGVDMNDLIQEGSIGLLRGLEKFDHRKGYKLSTYVHWWIRQGMTRAIAEHSRLVRVPVYLHEIMFAIGGAKASLAHQGKPATVENLSLLLKVPSYKIKRALQAKNRIRSLDKTDNSYGLKMDFNGLHEFVADRNRENQPWDSLIEEDMKENVRNRMTVLTPKEQMIIRWIYGIDTEGGTQSSLTAVSKKLGISKERVRQYKDRALSKMRRSEEDNSARDNNLSLIVHVYDHF